MTHPPKCTNLRFVRSTSSPTDTVPTVKRNPLALRHLRLLGDLGFFTVNDSVGLGLSPANSGIHCRLQVLLGSASAPSSTQLVRLLHGLEQLYHLHVAGRRKVHWPDTDPQLRRQALPIVLDPASSQQLSAVQRATSHAHGE